MNARVIICCCVFQEMQLLLLRYREDIIAAKVSKEHQEETLKSEILFLKDQVSVGDRTKLVEGLWLNCPLATFALFSSLIFFIYA